MMDLFTQGLFQHLFRRVKWILHSMYRRSDGLQSNLGNAYPWMLLTSYLYLATPLSIAQGYVGLLVGIH